MWKKYIKKGCKIFVYNIATSTETLENQVTDFLENNDIIDILYIDRKDTSIMLIYTFK